MPLVRVKEKFQVTIPAEVREAVQLAVGDILETTVQGTTIILTPKAIVDRADARHQLLEVMDRVHAKQRPSKKRPRDEEEWIARQVKAHRKQHAKRGA
jgi:AbrB family looped-hinge helix DNA binding protein